MWIIIFLAAVAAGFVRKCVPYVMKNGIIPL
jgi:hypothetical protein